MKREHACRSRAGAPAVRGLWTAIVALTGAIALASLPGCRTAAKTAAAPDGSEPTPEDMALATRTEVAAKAAMGTPGQEYANFITTGWQRLHVERLKGTRKATPAEMAESRWYLKEYVVNLENGPHWPDPGTVQLPHAPAPPKCDGVLDDEVWKSAVRMTGMYAFNSTNRVDDPGTTWMAAWDETNLYFAFECQDKDIVAPDMARDDQVYAHDCVEAFILPDFREGLYWEVIVSPTGSIYDGLNAKRFADWGAETRAAENLRGLQSGQTVRGTANQTNDVDTGYTVEMAIPFAELPTYTRGNSPQAGDELHFMLARLDKNGGLQGKMIPYGFRPLLSWGHNIWNHARLKLLAPPAEPVPPAVPAVPAAAAVPAAPAPAMPEK